MGFDVVEKIIEDLKTNGFATRGVVANLLNENPSIPAPIVIQSFDRDTLVSLHAKCD